MSMSFTPFTFRVGRASRRDVVDLTTESSTASRSLFSPHVMEDDTKGWDTRSQTAEQAYKDEELDGFEEMDILDTHAFSLPAGSRLLSSAKSPTGCHVKPGICIVKLDGTFFKVKHIVQNDKTERIDLRGFSLVKPMDIKPSHNAVGTLLCRYFKQLTNELVAVLNAPANKYGTLHSNTHLDSVSLDEVAFARKIIFTNQKAPKFSYTEHGMSKGHPDPNDASITVGATHTIAEIEELGILVCRHKYVEEKDDRGRKVTGSGQWLSLTEDECDPGKAIPDVLISRQARVQAMQEFDGGTKSMRGKKRKGRAADNLGGDEDSVQVMEEDIIETFTTFTSKKQRASRFDTEGVCVVEKERTTQTSVQSSKMLRRGTLPGGHDCKAPTQRTARRNTGRKPFPYSELCAGGGLMTRAAIESGLPIKAVLDINPVCCQTLRLNCLRLGTQIIEMDLCDIVNHPEVLELFDTVILHFSAPCTGFSAANRNTNPDQDDVNNDVCLVLGEILKRCKRIRRVILEQSPRIRTKHDGIYFRSLILVLTQAGFNVRTKVLEASSYGGTQTRGRLIVLASCAGEEPPNFPEPTHGSGRGLKPPTTINQALANISPGASLHNIQERRRLQRTRPKADDVSDGNAQLATMTCGGPQVLHPDGDRWFTYREMMALMGLPDEHELYGVTQEDFVKQVGNGVIVPFGKAIFAEVIKSLEKSDQAVEAYEAKIRAEAMEID